MEIYFVFFLPPQKKKKETPPTLHTLAKPHEPTLKTKALPKSAISPTHTVLCSDFNCIFEKRKKRKIKI
jgi:hypothetical protein